MKIFVQLLLVICFESQNSWAIENNNSRQKYIYNYNLSDCIYDPYEKLNRRVFRFNSVVDFYLLKPCAKVYDRFTNSYIRNRIESFFLNISEPLSTVNYLIEGNFEGAVKSFWRFTINSTFGVVGVFDIASKMGLKVPQKSLSTTLAYYGVGPGPYIVLPILGGNNIRDMSDTLAYSVFLNFLPSLFLDNTNLRLSFNSLSLINKRSKVMAFTEFISQNSLDPYTAVRQLVSQKKYSK